MIFSNQQYRKLQKRLARKYHSRINLTDKNLGNFPQAKISRWFQRHHDEIHHFTPLHWYFLQQLEKYLFLSKNQPQLKSSSTELTEEEDAIFDQWNQSEFAGIFLKNLNLGHSVGKASQLTLKKFDEHLITLGERYLLKSNKAGSFYLPQTSLGDVEQNKKVSRLLETTLHLDGKDLKLMTRTLKEMKLFSQRIEVALKVIRKHSPTSWEQFSQFTQTIIPIKNPELVSYSHQELPGHSMINLYHRDFVDLMDDLLHENGHHHLNYYLNLDHLIDEPADCIYYSPWRRTLRPLRGIYHAYFTFFWAFKLFSDLARAKEMDSIWYVFSSKEKEKILWRAVEEYWMLEYTFEDLKRARKQGLISDLGWELVKEQQQSLKKQKNRIQQWEKLLKIHKKDLLQLKKELASARKSYKLNTL
jgi:hypothetical protein